MALSRTIVTRLLCILLFAKPVTAQDRFSINSYGTENGLPSNGIKGLQYDAQTGFLWIATEAGIVRYNGSDFRIFSGEDDNHISNNRILFLIKNNADSIYTADEKGEIFFVNKNKLVFLQSSPVIPGRPNMMFALNVSYQLFSGKRPPGDTFASAPILDRILPVYDTACLVVKEGMLFYYSLRLMKPELIPLSFIPKNGFIIGHTYFITDFEGHIRKFDISSQTLTQVQPVISPDAGKFIFWQNGMKNPILINDGKAWKLDYSNDHFTTELICDSVPHDMIIQYVQYDELSKTIFIATESKGILVIKKNSVESILTEKQFINNGVSYYSQVALQDGNVLTNTGNVLGKNKITPGPLPITGRFSSFVYSDPDSVLWFAKLDSQFRSVFLHSFSYKTGETKKYPSIRNVEPVITKIKDNLYLGDSYGLWRMVGDSLVLEDSTVNENDVPRHAYDLKEIEPGILAMATCNILFRYDTKSHQLDTIFNGGNYCIRAIWVYNGYVFFGTYGNGLYVYKNGKVKPLPLDKNKYLLFTHCFMKDDYGYCWISTNNGLFKADIAEIVNAWENDVPNVYYHYFGKKDGMVMTEMNGGCAPCAVELKDKTISFPTMDGLLWVDPSKAKPSLNRHDIYIDELLADGKRIQANGLNGIEFPAGTREIEMKIAYTVWNGAENNYIEYQLDDTINWKKIDPDDETLLRFNNFSSGNHYVRLRKMTGFGGNKYTYKVLTFSVSAMWYEKWWFYLLEIVGLFGLIYLFVWMRTRQYKIKQRNLEKQIAEKTKELMQKNEILEKNDAIKTRLISIINHDIITPLKFLAVAGKNLIEKKKMMSEEIKDETIREMTTTSSELQGLSTNILNWIKYQNQGRGLLKEKFDLHDLAEQIINILGPVASQKNIRVINAVQKDQEVYHYFEPLKILIYNLFSNAINFSEKGTITIRSVTVGDQVTLAIADEGIGMSPEQIRNITEDKIIIHSARTGGGKGNGLGYLIIKDLTVMTGVALKIESKQGAGTTVYLNFSMIAGESKPKKQPL